MPSVRPKSPPVPVAMTPRAGREMASELAPGRDPMEQALAVAQLGQMVGEFEKPKFFSYNPKICAHGRSGKTGCSKCIDVCSTGAITSKGDTVEVEAHLCLGCGGCASVCPSGAMTHAYPRTGDLGRRIRRALSVYREAGGRDACLLFHDGEQSRDRIAISLPPPAAGAVGAAAGVAAGACSFIFF